MFGQLSLLEMADGEMEALVAQYHEMTREDWAIFDRTPSLAPAWDLDPDDEAARDLDLTLAAFAI